MTRGNQRDIDRERAKKRQDKGKKDKNEGFVKKQQSDAEIMREKQKKAEEKRQKEEEEKIRQENGGKPQLESIQSKNGKSTGTGKQNKAVVENQIKFLSKILEEIKVGDNQEKPEQNDNTEVEGENNFEGINNQQEQNQEEQNDHQEDEEEEKKQDEEVVEVIQPRNKKPIEEESNQ